MAYYRVVCLLFAWIERRGIGELADIEPLYAAAYIDANQMIRRRTTEAGFKIKLGCHVFRATGITAYLGAGGTLENAQVWRRTKVRAPPNSTTVPPTRYARRGRALHDLESPALPVSARVRSVCSRAARRHR